MAYPKNNSRHNPFLHGLVSVQISKFWISHITFQPKIQLWRWTKLIKIRRNFVLVKCWWLVTAFLAMVFDQVFPEAQHHSWILVMSKNVICFTSSIVKSILIHILYFLPFLCILLNPYPHCHIFKLKNLPKNTPSPHLLQTPTNKHTFEHTMRSLSWWPSTMNRAMSWDTM